MKKAVIKKETPLIITISNKGVSTKGGKNLDGANIAKGLASVAVHLLLQISKPDRLHYGFLSFMQLLIDEFKSETLNKKANAKK